MADEIQADEAELRALANRQLCAPCIIEASMHAGDEASRPSVSVANTTYGGSAMCVDHVVKTAQMQLQAQQAQAGIGRLVVANGHVDR